MASFLSSVPVFSKFDPLPIATSKQKATKNKEKNKTDHKQPYNENVDSVLEADDS